MRVSETRLSIDDLTEVSWSYAHLDVEPRGRRAMRFLEVHLAGPYGVGSSGRNDALALRASILFGWQLWACDGLLLNLTKLDYVWGDDLFCVLEIGNDRNLSPLPVPTALLCAEWNRTAYAGLVDGIGKEPLPYLTVDHRKAVSWLVNKC